MLEAMQAKFADLKHQVTRAVVNNPLREWSL